MRTPSRASRASAADRRHQVGRHRVRDRIQRMILSGKLRPGAKLVQLRLAEQLDVSQGLVREALLELQASGLVETVDNRGMFVAKLNVDKLLEAVEVRAALEGLAARRCCETASRSQLRELTDLAERCYSLGEEGKPKQMASLDKEFHLRLLHLSGNSMLIRLAEQYRVLGKILRSGRDPKPVREEHLAVVRAIGKGDADRAERLMREHIMMTKAMVQQRVADGTFVPKWVL